MEKKSILRISDSAVTPDEHCSIDQKSINNDAVSGCCIGIRSTQDILDDMYSTRMLEREVKL